jgi:K(+)-stimulated pyrophosphate-energized sodium pump
MQGLNSFEQIAIYAVLAIAILGLAYAVFLRAQILREDKGSARMQEVWGWIREGADAYLARQLRSILPLIAVLTVALFFSVYIVPPTPEAREWYCSRASKPRVSAARASPRSVTPAPTRACSSSSAWPARWPL